MTQVSDIPSLSVAEKDALITTLLARVAALDSRVTALESEFVELRAENAALRAKLRLPPKTSSNSSTPPSGAGCLWRCFRLVPEQWQKLSVATTDSLLIILPGIPFALFTGHVLCEI
jgi:hypothetical protein